MSVRKDLSTVGTVKTTKSTKRVVGSLVQTGREGRKLAVTGSSRPVILCHRHRVPFSTPEFFTYVDLWIGGRGETWLG